MSMNGERKREGERKRILYQIRDMFQRDERCSAPAHNAWALLGMSFDSIFALFDACSDELDSNSDDKGKFEAKQDDDVVCRRHESSSFTWSSLFIVHSSLHWFTSDLRQTCTSSVQANARSQQIEARRFASTSGCHIFTFSLMLCGSFTQQWHGSLTVDRSIPSMEFSSTMVSWNHIILLLRFEKLHMSVPAMWPSINALYRQSRLTRDFEMREGLSHDYDLVVQRNHSFRDLLRWWEKDQVTCSSSRIRVIVIWAVLVAMTFKDQYPICRRRKLQLKLRSNIQST